MVIMLKGSSGLGPVVLESEGTDFSTTCQPAPAGELRVAVRTPAGPGGGCVPCSKRRLVSALDSHRICCDCSSQIVQGSSVLNSDGHLGSSWCQWVDFFYVCLTADSAGTLPSGSTVCPIKRESAWLWKRLTFEIGWGGPLHKALGLTLRCRICL